MSSTSREFNTPTIVIFRRWVEPSPITILYSLPGTKILRNSLLARGAVRGQSYLLKENSGLHQFFYDPLFVKNSISRDSFKTEIATSNWWIQKMKSFKVILSKSLLTHIWRRGTRRRWWCRHRWTTWCWHYRCGWVNCQCRLEGNSLVALLGIWFAVGECRLE